MNIDDRRRWAGAVCLAAVFILHGCATTDADLGMERTGHRRDPVMLGREPLMRDSAEMRDTIPSSMVASEQVLPTEIAGRAASAAPVETTVRALPTQIIKDLDLADTVDVVTLLRVMARSAGVNLLISPDVSGMIGFTFRDVPWDQAFNSILASAGLTYAWQGDVLRVMTLEDVRRELALETVLKDRENVKVELRRTEPMVLQVIPIRYLSAEKLGETVKRMLAVTGDAGVSGDGSVGRQKSSVSVDSGSNSIIVHSVRDEVEKVLKLVEQLDRARPLVQIEAKIVEATQDTAQQLGMQWGGQSTRRGGSRIATIGGDGVTAAGYNSDFPALFATSPNPAMGFSLGLVSDRVGMGELLNLQLTALQQQGRIQIHASPTVTTLDNQTALIESGEERAYRVSTGSGTVQEGTLEWKKAVLKLEVTPHVVDGKRLRVQIVAHKDSFDETKPQTNNEFPVNTKRANTTVMLMDGETTMIGGFALESKSNSASGVPFLMHIPLLGNLFKSRASSARFDETIIFITPTIL